MLRILSALCLLLTTMIAVRAVAQVYPYRDGTPRRHRISLGSDGRGDDPGKRVRPPGRSHSC
jgi:hypothetical protein